MPNTLVLVREVAAGLVEIKGRTETIIPAVIEPAADRWLLASLLQKAIRRGHAALALGVALRLLEIDSSRLWRRLMTIAREDIGVGDLDTTLLLVAASGVPAVPPKAAFAIATNAKKVSRAAHDLSGKKPRNTCKFRSVTET